jgi:hypothetical protein
MSAKHKPVKERKSLYARIAISLLAEDFIYITEFLHERESNRSRFIVKAVKDAIKKIKKRKPSETR